MFGRRIVLLFVSLTIIGFVIGYGYVMITSVTEHQVAEPLSSFEFLNEVEMINVKESIP